MPSPPSRKKTGPDFRQDCACCETGCDCKDCGRCAEAGVEAAGDRVPPPAR